VVRSSLGRAVAGLFTVLIVSSCREASRLIRLQKELSTRFQSPTVTVTVSSPSAIVVGVPSDLARDSARPRLALEIALFVRDHYDGSAQVIAVSFDSVARTGPFSVANNRMMYQFDRSDLGKLPQSR
jgi:hypothetical protein